MMSARSLPLRLMTLVLLVGAAHGISSPRLPKWFWGCWTVKKDLYVRDISGLAPKLSKAMIGRRIVFQPAYARSGSEIIRSPQYGVEVLSNRQFFEDGSYVNLDEIGVHSHHVIHISVVLPYLMSDVDFPGSEIYLRKQHKDIVFVVEGEYFLAERAAPNDTKCSCPKGKSKAAK